MFQNPFLIQRRKQSGQKIPYEKRVFARSLTEMGLSTRKVANVVGISQNSVSCIGRDKDLDPNLVEQFKNLIVGRFYKKSHLALDQVTEENLSKLNAYQNILVAKISLDAARMAEGLPTHSVQIKTLAVKLTGDISELRKKREGLVATLGGVLTDLPPLSIKGEKK